MARRPGRALVVGLAAAAVLSGGCTSTHRRGSPLGRPAPPPPPVGPISELSYGVNASPPGNWNVLAAGIDLQALAPVADQVWLSAFSVGPDFNPVLNTALIESATQTSTSPQTVVYRINPKATWSDGTAVTGSDFVYNWQAQSGSAAYTDVGGVPYTPADASPYRLVRSVTVSPASPDTVTVVFSGPDPDWTQLFRHVAPAHVAQRVGFDSGFTDPATDLVSDGPYLVRSYEPSGVVHLVRNPSFAGGPAGALELDIHFLPDVDQLTASLAQNQLSCAEVPATEAGLSALRSSPTLSVKVGAGPDFLDLVFNSASGPMHSPDERSAVTRAVSRPDVLSSGLAGVNPQADPVTNRFLVAGEAGYTSNTIPAIPGGKASSATSATPTSLKLVEQGPSESDAAAGAAGKSIVQELGSAGFPVQVTEAAAVPPAMGGTWDLALVERQITPWPTEALGWYQSSSSANIGGLSSSAVDTAIESAFDAPASLFHGLVDEADEAVWGASADLPLFSLPQVVACQANVTGVTVNPSPDGPAYNASGWGQSGGAS